MRNQDPLLDEYDEPDVDDLDAPLRRELDAFYRDPEVERRMRDAFDAEYAIGGRRTP